MWINVWCQVQSTKPPIEFQFLQAHWLEFNSIEQLSTNEFFDKLWAKCIPEKSIGYDKELMKIFIFAPYIIDEKKSIEKSIEKTVIQKNNVFLTSQKKEIKKISNILF